MKYTRNPNKPFFVKCYWCESCHYTDWGRFLHLLNDHPEFFEEYDKINGWGVWPFSTHNIPEKPDGL